MPISHQSVRTQRQWRAATGLTQEQFTELTILFGKTYEDFHEESLLAIVARRTDDVKFKTYEDLLFFILYSLKSGLTYDLIALSFDISRSVAFEQQAAGVRILQMTLQANDHLPRQNFESLEDLERSLDGYDELLIDGTEQRRQRPGNQDDQKEDYSGKKKAHTIKTTIISTPERRVLYVGPAYCGTVHDYAMVRDEFDPRVADWFMNKKIWIDLGYQGFKDDYSSIELQIPVKRPRRKKRTDAKIAFTDEQRTHNKSVSSKRIYVEHAIGGIKRYRFLSDRLRCRDARFYTTVMRVCAGLWNFQLSC